MCVMLSVCRTSERVRHNQGPFASLVTLAPRNECKQPVCRHTKKPRVNYFTNTYLLVRRANHAEKSVNGHVSEIIFH